MKLAVKITIILFLAMSTFVNAHAQTIKSGKISGRSISWTAGSISIAKSGDAYTLKLGKNFKTKRGPALYVYLGNGKPQKRIGKLKAIEGSQTYKLPKSFDPEKYREVFIHCVPFNATFGAGDLH